MDTDMTTAELWVCIGGTMIFSFMAWLVVTTKWMGKSRRYVGEHWYNRQEVGNDNCVSSKHIQSQTGILLRHLRSKERCGNPGSIGGQTTWQEDHISVDEVGNILSKRYTKRIRNKNSVMDARYGQIEIMMTVVVCIMLILRLFSKG